MQSAFAPAKLSGLAGLLGSGTTDVLQRLFGLAPAATPVRIKGRLRRIRNPIAAIEAGIGFVPPSRRLGLIMNLVGARQHPAAEPRSRQPPRRPPGIVAELMDLLDIRPRRPDMKVSALSGGNQQKVILAKWLARRVEVLLLDEPTQGIDIAAKAQIHALLRDFAARGGGVLLRFQRSFRTRLCLRRRTRVAQGPHRFPHRPRRPA